MTREVSTSIKREFRKLNWITVSIFLIVFLGQGAVFIFFARSILEDPFWLPALSIASAALLVTAVITYLLIDAFGRRVYRTSRRTFDLELSRLRAANNRAKSLQEMASVMRLTLSFERVMEEALNACSLTLEEMGIPARSLAGAVFLYDGEDLVPVATRRFVAADYDKSILGKRGVVGKALQQAEIVETDTPRQDPELRAFVAFQNCSKVVCIPLRAGFHIFGAIAIGTDSAVQFRPDHFELFTAIADQAVIALQNAQLFQELEDEKQRLIEADEEARKELARDLHDGPTQSIAAIAMRINFIRSLISRDPAQALTELEKVERLAKQTSKEIRGTLFRLRPLVLETKGLAAAIQAVMKRIEETDGLHMRLEGGEKGELLDDQAQGVVFSIVEEALGNARKYSEANLVQVNFWQEENLFVAMVKDDGVGFDPQEVNRDYSSRGSLGMVNMKERAERIDGSLRVESAPGRGTTVTIVVPLDKHGRKVPHRTR